MPLVSLCATNYRTHPITRQSLDSILRQVADLDYEIVVVDSFSEDGSYEILESYVTTSPLRLARRRCSRGIGRQTAYTMSRGDYVVTFDLDTVYNENWGQLLRWVLANRIPYGLSAVYSQFYPRRVVEQVGGWRDFQYWEDVDLWIRLARRGLYRTYPLVCGRNLKRGPGRGRLEKAVRLYAKCRDKVAITDWIPFRLYARGYLMLLRHPTYLYHTSLFIPGFVLGRIKRMHLCRGNYDTSLIRRRDIEIDCGLAPPDQLLSTASPYNTAEGCEQAIARGDFGFLPKIYD